MNSREFIAALHEREREYVIACERFNRELDYDDLRNVRTCIAIEIARWEKDKHQVECERAFRDYAYVFQQDAADSLEGE